MAEMFSSAVVQETVTQIVSSVLNRDEGTSSSVCSEHQLERLEMAHIKLEAALEASEKWHITDASLLRWQKKLKCVSKECGDMLQKCEQQLQEQEVRNSSSLPKRIAHATKSFISSMFYGNCNELSRSALQRFEWFAGSASEFLRFVEYGGTPRQYTFFHSLTKHLLAGETIAYKLVWGNKYRLFRIRPLKNADHRIAAKLTFVYKNNSVPEDNFVLALMLHLSESTDIIGVSIKCLPLLTHHFESMAETVRKELTQLPTQDFTFVPYVYSHHAENWENIHTIHTQWFRPDPLCCKQQYLHKSCGTGGGIMDMSEISDTSLEPVIDVYLEWHVSLSRFDEYRIKTNRKRSSAKESSLLKLGLAFMPHCSSEDHLQPTFDSSLIEVINGQEQHCLHTNITLEQLGKVMLPKAIDCIHQNSKGTTYQMLWKSKHGRAYFHAAKESMQIMTKRSTVRGVIKEMMFQQQHQELQSETGELFAFLSLWAAHAPVQMQSSIRDWIQKEKETHNVLGSIKKYALH